MLHVIILRIVVVDAIVSCFTLILSNGIGSEFTRKVAQVLSTAC